MNGMDFDRAKITNTNVSAYTKKKKVGAKITNITPMIETRA